MRVPGRVGQFGRFGRCFPSFFSRRAYGRTRGATMSEREERTCELCARPAHEGDYVCEAVAGPAATPVALLCLRCVAALGRDTAEARFVEVLLDRWPDTTLTVREAATWRTGPR